MNIVKKRVILEFSLLSGISGDCYIQKRAQYKYTCVLLHTCCLIYHGEKKQRPVFPFVLAQSTRQMFVLLLL